MHVCECDVCVLNFIHGEDLNVDELSKGELSRLLSDAHYYHLPGMCVCVYVTVVCVCYVCCVCCVCTYYYYYYY